MNERDPAPGAAGGLGLRGRAKAEERAKAMRVLALDPSGGTLARCAGTDGVATTVETTLVETVEPDAILLVQAGLALARLDAEWVP